MGLKILQQLKALFTREGFAPERIGTLEQWIEIVAISLGAVAVSWFARPGDPTLSQLSFPWLWLAPVLIALRYGVLPGLISGTVLLVNGWIATQLGRAPVDVSAAPMFGGGLLVLLCGEFSDVWRDRNRRMEETYLYVTERLSRLTKRHLLLNLSHDRLEQEMLARPGSLRDALVRLRSLTLDLDKRDQPLPGADGLLQLLSQYVNIEAAQIFTLVEKNGTYALGALAASLGDPDVLLPDDELLTLALETGSLAHIAGQDISMRRRTSQLVVAPLVAGDSQLIGVLSVTRMPFFSLNVENLQMMLVLLGYYADNVGSAFGVASIQKQLPGMPFLFAQELARTLRLHEKIGMASHLVVMRFHGSRGHEIADNFLRIKRGLDLYWKTVVNNFPILVILLPFASSSAKDGFLERVEAWLESHFKGDFVSLDVMLHVIDFDVRDPLSHLKEAMGTP